MQYLTRVELHSATEQQYNRLHAAMARQRFYRTIDGDNGQMFHLPWGTYFSFGDVTAPEVRSFARWAVSESGAQGEILVAMAPFICWEGLIPLVPLTIPFLSPF